MYRLSLCSFISAHVYSDNESHFGHDTYGEIALYGIMTLSLLQSSASSYDAAK